MSSVCIPFSRLVGTSAASSAGFHTCRLLDQGEMLVLGAGRAIGKSWFGMLSEQPARGYGRVMGTYIVRRAARVLNCGEGDWASFGRWERLCRHDATPDGLLESFEPWRIRIVRRRITSSGDGTATSTEQIDAEPDHLEVALESSKDFVLDVGQQSAANEFGDSKYRAPRSRRWLIEAYPEDERGAELVRAARRLIPRDGRGGAG